MDGTFPCCGSLCECGKQCCGSYCACMRFWRQSKQRLSRRPLMLYVLLTTALCGYELWQCLRIATDAEFKDNCIVLLPNAMASGGSWLLMMYLMAGITFLLTTYIQHRFWENLRAAANDIQEAIKANEASANDVSSAGERIGSADSEVDKPRLDTDVVVDVPMENVKKAFVSVFMDEFGGLVYVIALLGSVFWSFMGYRWLHGQDNCNPEGRTTQAMVIGCVSPIFAIVYSIGLMAWLKCGKAMSVDTGTYTKHGATIPRDTKYSAMREDGPRGDEGEDQRAMRRLAVPEDEPRVSQSAAAHKRTTMMLSYVLVKAIMLLVLPFAFTHTPAGTHARGLAQVDDKADDTWQDRISNPETVVKLVACLVLDVLGLASFVAPGFGEVVDVVAFAPFQGLCVALMFQAPIAAFLSFAEEAIPFATDAIPSCTILWFLAVFLPNSSVAYYLNLGDSARLV